MSTWLKALQRVRTETVEKVPKGWKTSAQIGKELGLSESRTRGLIAEMVKAGRAEAKTFKIHNGSRIYPTPHYRVRWGANRTTP